jgi:hypothetical protein
MFPRPGREVPTGGIDDDVLTRIAGTPDYDWRTPSGGAGTLLYFARGLAPDVVGAGVSCNNGFATQIHDARGGGSGKDLDVAIVNIGNIFDGDWITIPSAGDYEIELSGHWDETNTSAGQRSVFLNDNNSPGPTISDDGNLAATAIGWIATTNQIPGMITRYSGPLMSGLHIFPEVMQQSGFTMKWFTRYLSVRKR